LLRPFIIGENKLLKTIEDLPTREELKKLQVIVMKKLLKD
jgi:hypothetical protein